MNAPINIDRAVKIANCATALRAASAALPFSTAAFFPGDQFIHPLFGIGLRNAGARGYKLSKISPVSSRHVTIGDAGGKNMRHLSIVFCGLPAASGWSERNRLSTS